MKWIRLEITPRTAFGTLPKGDTLFGQMCWAVRNRMGESRLVELLEGYTTGCPFAVVSDFLPLEYLPRPALPINLFHEVEGVDHKTLKKRIWISTDSISRPVSAWLSAAKMDNEITGKDTRYAQWHYQPHNTINRSTGTTGEDMFAPYSMEQLWYAPDTSLECHVIVDEARFSVQEVTDTLADIGAIGFGRDASIGLGKYEVKHTDNGSICTSLEANAWLTLAPCAPQGLGFVSSQSYYTPFTRFGRHGDIAVYMGQPFKTPILLANTGAILTPTTYESLMFVGQGLGGDGSLSKSIPETIHQGYSPVIGIQISSQAERVV